MKSNEEMVRSVLERAKIARARQARIRRVVISAAACFCLVAFAVLGTAERWLPEVMPTESSEQNSKNRLSVFSVSAAEYKTMIEDVEIPLGLLHVRDMKGHSELEKVFIRREALAVVEEFTEGAWSASRMGRANDTAIFTMGFRERLMVVPEDVEQVAEFSAVASNGRSIGSAINPNLDLDTGEFYRGIEIWWNPSDEQIEQFMKDPYTKRSIVEDTITVTVKFDDGYTELVVIDVDVDDEGYIYMTYRGGK